MIAIGNMIYMPNYQIVRSLSMEGQFKVAIRLATGVIGNGIGNVYLEHFEIGASHDCNMWSSIAI